MDLTKEASSSTGGSARPWNGLEDPGTWLHSSWPSSNCRRPSVCQQSTWDDPKKRDQIGALLSFIYSFFLIKRERERERESVGVFSKYQYKTLGWAHAALWIGHQGIGNFPIYFHILLLVGRFLFYFRAWRRGTTQLDWCWESEKCWKKDAEREGKGIFFVGEEDYLVCIAASSMLCYAVAFPFSQTRLVAKNSDFDWEILLWNTRPWRWLVDWINLRVKGTMW